MLRIKYLVLPVILIVVLLVASCSDVGTNISVATTASTDTLTTIPENTSTAMPLPTETKPAPTPLPPIKTQCAGNSNETPKVDLEGVVALNKAAKLDDAEFGFFLLNLKNRNTIRNVDDGMFQQVSPDRKYLAYVRADRA